MAKGMLKEAIRDAIPRWVVPADLFAKPRTTTIRAIVVFDNPYMGVCPLWMEAERVPQVTKKEGERLRVRAGLDPIVPDNPKSELGAFFYRGSGQEGYRQNATLCLIG